MARNPVQFQKGISLNEFLSLYGTEQQCFDALYHWRWPNGFVCPNCGHDRGCQLTTHKLQQCYRCNRQTSITAGTIFEATKLPPDGVVPGHLLHDSGQERCIGDEAAPPTRHLLQRRMAHAPQADAGDDGARPRPSARRIHQLDDAYLGGERSGGKRGRGAPGKTPFVAAVETNAEGHPLRVKLTVVEGFRLTEIAAWAQQHLSPGTQVLSDGLACFNGVTAAGCVHEPMVTGGGESRGRAFPEFRWVNTILGNIKNALCGTYHAVRPKYAQRYLAEFEYRFNRRFDLPRHHPQTGLRGAANPADAGAAAQVTLGLSGNQEGDCTSPC